jgi:MGT family glycosyltransferase
MARFLFSVLPTRGHMYPSLPVAHALRDAGHAVAFLSVPEFRHLLEPHGITYLPLERPAEGGAMPAHRSRRDDSGVPEAAIGAFLSAFIRPLPGTIRALLGACSAWSPEVLVNDYVSYAGLIAAELLGLPVATLNMTVVTWPGQSLGPFGRGLPPARDATTRAYYAELRSRSEAAFGGVLAAYNAVREWVGLPPKHGPLSLATLSPYLQIVQTIAALDYDRDDLPPQVHYVGPCAWDPGEMLDRETASWLAGLQPDQPLVLAAASGAFTRSSGLVEAALGGLAGSPVALLATLPLTHALHEAGVSGRADHRLVRFAAHSQVLPRSGVVVTHGGFGTVTKALLHGLPLVIVPYAGDQPEVAQRVVAAGAGVALSPEQLTPETLRLAVESVLSEQEYQRSAQRLAALMARCDGPGESARLMGLLAETGRLVVRPPSPRYEPAPDVAERMAVPGSPATAG